jgi:hypothetical protein
MFRHIEPLFNDDINVNAMMGLNRDGNPFQLSPLVEIYGSEDEVRRQFVIYVMIRMNCSYEDEPVDLLAPTDLGLPKPEEMDAFLARVKTDYAALSTDAFPSMIEKLRLVKEEVDYPLGEEYKCSFDQKFLREIKMPAPKEKVSDVDASTALTLNKTIESEVVGEHHFPDFYADLTRDMDANTLSVAHQVLKLSAIEKGKFQRFFLYGRVASLPPMTNDQITACKTTPVSRQKRADTMPDPMEDTPASRILSAPEYVTLHDPIMENSRITIGPGVVSVTPNKRDVVSGYFNQRYVYEALIKLVKDPKALNHMKEMMVGSNFKHFDAVYMKYRIKKGVPIGTDGKFRKKGVLLGVFGEFVLMKYGQYTDFAHLSPLLKNMNFNVAITTWAPSPLGTMVAIAKSEKGQKVLKSISEEIKSKTQVVKSALIVEFLEVSNKLQQGESLGNAYQGGMSTLAYASKLACVKSVTRMLAGDRAISEVASNYIVLAPILAHSLILMDGCKGDGWSFMGAHQIASIKQEGTYTSDAYGMPGPSGIGDIFPHKHIQGDPVTFYEKVDTIDSDQMPVYRCIPNTVFPDQSVRNIVCLHWEHDEFVLRKENVPHTVKKKHLGQMFGVSHKAGLYRGPFLVVDKEDKRVPRYDKALVVVPISHIAAMVEEFKLYHVQIIMGPMQMMHSVIMLFDSTVPEAAGNYLAASVSRIMMAHTIHRMNIFSALYGGVIDDAQSILEYQRAFLMKASFFSDRITDAIKIQDLNEMFKPPTKEQQVKKTVNSSLTKMGAPSSLDALHVGFEEDKEVTTTTTTTTVVQSSAPIFSSVVQAPAPVIQNVAPPIQKPQVPQREASGSNSRNVEKKPIKNNNNNNRKTWDVNDPGYDPNKSRNRRGFVQNKNVDQKNSGQNFQPRQIHLPLQPQGPSTQPQGLPK